MNLPLTSIIKEELNTVDEDELSKRFIINKENLHNGTTFIFKSKENEVVNDKDKRYFQFKTIIEENNQEYFIYDEIIQINEKPILLMRIFNDQTKRIWEQIIYLGNNNEVVEQIRDLTYQQITDESKNNEKILSSEEDSSTTIIKTPFLPFIENINQEKNEFNQQKPSKKNWWKRLPWKILGLVVFLVAWSAIPVIGNLLIAPLLVGVVSASVITWLPFATAGLITGCVVAGFNRYRTRLKKWLFPKWKAKSEINLENKLAEQRIMLEKKYQSDLFLTTTSQAKQEWLLNGFQKIWNKNKIKSFATIETELSEKFERNKQEVQKQEFTRDYSQKINEWNQNWNEKEAFSRTLTPKNIAEIKKIFDETEKNKKIMCDGFFYQPKALWTSFQEEQNLESIQNLFENSEKNDNLKSEKDINKKSPAKNMKKTSCLV